MFLDGLDSKEVNRVELTDLVQFHTGISKLTDY